MKNVFKKGLVVLLASLFVSSVFAADATTTAAKPATTKHAVKHCVKACKNVKNKKACKKNCKKMHKADVKKAEATTSKTAQ